MTIPAELQTAPTMPVQTVQPINQGISQPVTATPVAVPVQMPDQTQMPQYYYNYPVATSPYAMPQSSVYGMPGTYGQCGTAPQSPSVNAVKIDIIGPQAYGGSPSQAPMVSPYSAPVYNQTPMPYMMQPPMMYPQGAPQVAMPMPAPTFPAPIQQQQQQQQGPAMPQSVAPQPPTPPPPSLIEGQKAPEHPKAEPQKPAEAPKPTAQQPPTQQPPQTPVDIAGIVTQLKSPSYDDQASAINKIAEIAATNPQQALELLNEPLMRGLSDIVNSDTTKLNNVAPPVPEQPQGAPPIEKPKSDKEKAEENKIYAMYTLGVLEKNFRQAADMETQKAGQPQIQIAQLPGITPLVLQAKTHPNPKVRVAALQTLSWLADPENGGKPQDYDILSTIFKIAAEQDADPEVVDQAQKSLKIIESIKPKSASQAPQTQETQQASQPEIQQQKAESISEPVAPQAEAIPGAADLATANAAIEEAKKQTEVPQNAETQAK